MPEEKCLKCGRKRFAIVYDRGEIICAECGYLIAEYVPPSDMPGWTALIAKQGKTPDRFSSSPVKAQNKDSRMAASALSELDRMVSYLHLPKKVRESAISLYAKCIERNAIRNISKGRHAGSIIAALIYYACREQKIRMAFGKIIKASDADKEEAEEIYSAIAREIKK
jgi:transcription initiation factor TFIIB